MSEYFMDDKETITELRTVEKWLTERAATEAPTVEIGRDTVLVIASMMRRAALLLSRSVPDVACELCTKTIATNEEYSFHGDGARYAHSECVGGA